MPTYELKNDNLIKELKFPVKELEKYAKCHFPNSINAFLFGEEPRHLISQVRFSANIMIEENHENTLAPKKELWLVKDDPKQHKLIFI